MPRKPITRYLRSIARLRSTIKFSRATLGRHLAERPAAVSAATGKPGFTYHPVFDHLDAELAAVHRELTAAESAYDCAQIEAIQLRRKRDRAAAKLHNQHTPIERFCRSQPDLKGAGIVGPTPEAADALALQVSTTVEFLRSLAAAGPTPPGLRPGVKIDAGALADDLEAGLPRLNAAIRAVISADSDLRFARYRAEVAFNQAEGVVPWVSRTLENLSALAGEERLAGRIRKCCG